MARGRVIGAVLSVFAGLTVAIQPAHAGGGMGAGSGVTTCRIVLNGAPNQPQTIRVIDSFLSSDTADTVKVGALVMLCDLPAVGTTVNSPPAPLTGAPVADPNSVACYAVSGADQARIDAAIQDPFSTALNVSATQPVAIGAIQLFCVPAVTGTP